MYDVLIVGGGPAGLNAALVLGRALRSVLIVDSGDPRNARAQHVNGYLGAEGRTPRELRAAGGRQIDAVGVRSMDGMVIEASCDPGRQSSRASAAPRSATWGL